MTTESFDAPTNWPWKGVDVLQIGTGDVATVSFDKMFKKIDRARVNDGYVYCHSDVDFYLIKGKERIATIIFDPITDSVSVEWHAEGYTSVTYEAAKGPYEP